MGCIAITGGSNVLRIWIGSGLLTEIAGFNGASALQIHKISVVSPVASLEKSTLDLKCQEEPKACSILLP